MLNWLGEKDKPQQQSFEAMKQLFMGIAKRQNKKERLKSKLGEKRVPLRLRNQKNNEQ